MHVFTSTPILPLIYIHTHVRNTHHTHARIKVIGQREEYNLVSLMSKDITVIPTGFLKVTIALDDTAKDQWLAYVRSYIALVSPDGRRNIISIVAGEPQIIPLKPGLYQINASLGDISSEQENVEIKIGEITTKVFHFGKNP